jgi:hypothetical protein
LSARLEMSSGIVFTPFRPAGHRRWSAEARQPWPLRLRTVRWRRVYCPTARPPSTWSPRRSASPDLLRIRVGPSGCADRMVPVGPGRPRVSTATGRPSAGRGPKCPGRSRSAAGQTPTGSVRHRLALSPGVAHPRPDRWHALRPLVPLGGVHRRCPEPSGGVQVAVRLWRGPVDARWPHEGSRRTTGAPCDPLTGCHPAPGGGHRPAGSVRRGRAGGRVRLLERGRGA